MAAATALPLVSLVGGATATAASPPCTPYEFIGARGSGEAPQPPSSDYGDKYHGMGELLWHVYDKIGKLIGTDKISAHGVVYPAVAVAKNGFPTGSGVGAALHIKVLGSYTDSVREGQRSLQGYIEARHKADACPDTKFIIGGYSQGAQAAGDALQHMPTADQQLVAAAVFFGDPYFNADSWSSLASDSTHYGSLGVRDEWPGMFSGKVFSYCRPHDPICGLSEKHHIIGDGDLYTRNFGWANKIDPHLQYVSSGDADDAARRVARTLGFPTRGSGTVPLDLVFAIDTTGSMGGTIAQVRDNVTSLAQSIAATSANYRFALIDYKDGADQGDPYRARVDLGFTNDVTSFANAAATLGADGGGDTPESVYSGVMTGLALPWRNGVRKVVIAIGDAPGKDPEPETGYTLATVRDRALAVDPAQVYTVATSSDPSANEFLAALASATGGQHASAPDPATFVSTLQSTIVSAGSAPTADAGGPYTAIVGEPVKLGAAGSRDETEDIVGFDWDFNGDGVYDQSTSVPTVSHAYGAPGEQNVVVRARAASGLAATATASVTVNAAPAVPASPTGLTATADDGTISLKWTKGSAGGLPGWYTIYDGTGAFVDRVSAQADGTPPSEWIDVSLANGTAYTYKVTAGNPAGESGSAGPVSVTPAVPNRAPVTTADSFTADNASQLVVPAPGVLANDTDPDTGDTLTAKLVTPTGHGSVSLLQDGSFTYTAKPGYLGTDTFTYTATDSRGLTSAPATVTITVGAATTSGQRIVFVGTGKPPVVLADRVLTGSFVIKRSGIRIDGITGTATIPAGKGKQATLTLDVRRSGSGWQATAKVVMPDGTIRTYSGKGVVIGWDRSTFAGFTAGKTRFGFTIVDPIKIR
ncbi:cutinase family protein [Amycolatopsis sp. NPDC051102]|uniref:cutinase family protein n=1 Tax=Amycolatopsis sp. NPDC051102 TaxID=3155163 RepID=UPI00343ABDB6